MTDKHLYTLIGKQFTLSGLPVLYTIVDVTSNSVHLKSDVSTTTLTLSHPEFLTAHLSGAFSYIGEPIRKVKEPVKEEEPINYFSLDDL